MDDRLHADRREQDGRGHLRAQYGCPQIAPGDVAEEARDDPPATECRKVRAHRVLASGAPEHPGHGVRRKRIVRPPLELRPVDRGARLARHPPGEHLELVVRVRRRGVGRLVHGLVNQATAPRRED
jgi:hypothetical protein